MGLLLNKIVPMEMLAEMPLPLVHRLRDIRCEQLKQQQQQSSNNNWNKNGIKPNNAVVDNTSMEDLIDELS